MWLLIVRSSISFNPKKVSVIIQAAFLDSIYDSSVSFKSKQNVEWIYKGPLSSSTSSKKAPEVIVSALWGKLGMHVVLLQSSIVS